MQKLTVPDDLFEKILERARQEQISARALLRRAIEFYLSRSTGGQGESVTVMNPDGAARTAPMPLPKPAPTNTDRGHGTQTDSKDKGESNAQARKDGAVNVFHTLTFGIFQQQRVAAPLAVDWREYERWALRERHEQKLQDKRMREQHKAARAQDQIEIAAACELIQQLIQLERLRGEKNFYPHIEPGLRRLHESNMLRPTAATAPAMPRQTGTLFERERVRQHDPAAPQPEPKGL